MASIPCITHPPITSKLNNFFPSPHVSASNLASRFLGTEKSVGWLSLTSRIGPSNGSKATCWFRFGKNGVDAQGAGIYGSQARDDFDRDDVEQYFNYMGMLAVDGTYDRMEALLSLKIHPVDILLLLAASEGDKPKIEELLRAGAKYDVKDGEGRTALDRANEEIKDFILNFSVQRIKYVGDEQEKRSLKMKGLNLMDKTLSVQGARISFSIWDVAGDTGSLHQIPIACKDSVAILVMFDLTNRCTLNSVMGWYSKARKWNQTAIPILIGTKFDDFVRLPPDVQWTIVTQARAYARAMKATLFFSSSTHNINVNKIFKFIMAKLFNLPWKVERNLTLGEPTIDF